MQILERRPIVVALAGPNGAGKTTFFHSFLASTGLHFVNADVIAQRLNLDPYRAAQLAAELRQQLISQRVSFVFETVFSDPVGDKLAFLKQAETSGYTVLLIFIGIATPELSDERVAIRVAQGGHDVPEGKIFERYPRVLRNLKKALLEVKNVRIYDNSDLAAPYRLVLTRAEGGSLQSFEPVPKWLSPLLPSR